ncbi:MAG: DUF362 domain-containing protein, partial [Deltaproteobacteria bacterium]|nr:DUF362 domain-containing protein [Deltaproteobacteria bacterium]
GPAMGNTACTEWPFMAALMRWFHDKLGISYHQMAVGEAPTVLTAAANLFSRLNPEGTALTPEAVVEGKSGSFYGGWGFYFVRRYLADSLGPHDGDDPMRGYDESVTGRYIPPGRVRDRLMVYDLNRIYDDPSKGREVKVPNGVNYKSITLHKAVIGGTPGDQADLEDYPGCVLINVPKLKVHCYTLLTNAIKNLGIGLYPMQYAKEGGCTWDYSNPHNEVPGMKGRIPHQVWIPELEPETGLPKRDPNGRYIVTKTGGITATMIDIIEAVNSQGIFSIHIVDAIQATNLDHQGTDMAQKESEGLVFAALDPVAVDHLCARYMFKNVPLKEALEEDMDGDEGLFLQAVPVPTVEDKSIVTRTGFDCPLSRDICLDRAQERGLGQKSYCVVGRDAITGRSLASLEGHLGAVEDGVFSELITHALYFDVFKIPWDLQVTTFKYLEAVDTLAGSSFNKEFLQAFDEDGDGIVTYEEMGKKGLATVSLHFGGELVSKLGTEEFGYLRSRFEQQAGMLKISDPSRNAHGHDVLKEYACGFECGVAFKMSQMETESPDPFMPGLIWGKGKWPGLDLARFAALGIAFYGQGFPDQLGFPSLYGFALYYADLTQNGGLYAGGKGFEPDQEGVGKYLSEVMGGKEKPLDFTFYVPMGFDIIGGSAVPNVEVTADPAKLMTASFMGGREQWAVL